MKNKILANLTVLILSLDVTLNDLNLFQVPLLEISLGVLTMLMLVSFFLSYKSLKISGYIFSLLLFFTFFLSRMLINFEIEGSISFNLPIFIKYLLYLLIGFNFAHLNYTYRGQ